MKYDSDFYRRVAEKAKGRTIYNAYNVITDFYPEVGTLGAALNIVQRMNRVIIGFAPVTENVNQLTYSRIAEGLTAAGITIAGAMLYTRTGESKSPRPETNLIFVSEGMEQKIDGGPECDSELGEKIIEEIGSYPNSFERPYEPEDVRLTYDRTRSIKTPDMHDVIIDYKCFDNNHKSVNVYDAAGHLIIKVKVKILTVVRVDVKAQEIHWYE